MDVFNSSVKKISSILGITSKGQATMANSLPVTIASNQDVIATAANQTAEATLIGAVTETAPASDTASSGLNGRMQRIAQRLTSLTALLPASLGQKTMTASLPVVVASDQGVLPVNGGVAHDAVDSGNPVKIGGKARTSIPTAVADGDRVDGYWDDRGRLITKDDTLNSAMGAIGDTAVINGGTGSALAQLRGMTSLLSSRFPSAPGRHTGVDSLAVGLITDDTQVTGNNSTAAITTDVGGTMIGFLRGMVKWAYERMPASLGPKAASASFPITFATNENNAVTYTLTSATPVPSGSDITNVNGGALTSADLTIRNTSQHWLLIPMGVSGYRTCTIHLKNDAATAWVSGQQPTIGLYAFFGIGTGFQGGQLLSFASNINAGNRYSISANDVSLVGGIGGAASPTLYSQFTAPAMNDGFPYLAVSIQSSVAPVQGEITQVVLTRMKY